MRLNNIISDHVPLPCWSQAERYGDRTARGIAAGLKGFAVHDIALVTAALSNGRRKCKLLILGVTVGTGGEFNRINRASSRPRSRKDARKMTTVGSSLT